MRHHHHIDLGSREVRTDELHGEDIVRAGRHLIARTFVERGLHDVEPLSPENPLIFSAGPFAGTNFSNANRVSVGCRSPLTGGIKESNGGGTFAFGLGQLGIAGITLEGAAEDWTLIHVRKGEGAGRIEFHDAREYLGMGNFAAAAKLHERFGKKVSLALCGPVGEYRGLLSGIAFSDTDLRPSRLAARGGVGAVMGSKRVKAIVVDLDRMPALHDRKKVMGAVKEYRKLLDAEPAIQAFQQTGTAMVADYTNHVGGIPVRNFSAGRAVDTDETPFRLGGDFLREQNLARGGEQTHACMPGCIIQCSNVYADADGEEIVSPVEYETIGLLGTNCGLDDPDELAHLNYQANDLGVDTIELGGTIGVLMEAGEGAFGGRRLDAHGARRAARRQRAGEALGAGHGRRRRGARRRARAGHQASGDQRLRPARDRGHRVVDDADGAGGPTTRRATCPPTTASARASRSCSGPGAASLDIQVLCAAADSLGLCVFGRSVTNERLDFIVQALNDAHGTALEASFFVALGRETLAYENAYNRAAGFGEADDELPPFFREEALPPSERTARFGAAEVRAAARRWWERTPSQGISPSVSAT